MNRRERRAVKGSDTTTPAIDSRGLLVYLSALVGREPSGLLEVRWRHGDGMKRRVYRVGDELVAAAAAIGDLGSRTDVYVGCAPRRGRAGGLDAVQRVWVLWADCDTPAAIAALDAFRPAAAIVVRSGSGENRHAYWALSGPIGVEDATAANRRLAHALGADGGAVTMAATILRPPGTANFKHTPAVAVVAERIRPWRRVSARRLVGELADPPARVTPRAERRDVGDVSGDVSGDDGLRQVAPAVYVQALTGLSAGRDGKVSCPFHGEDRAPSLHVYEDPAAGWYCYGCGRGGSIFDLGAEVFGLSTRGREFVELRARLQAALGAWGPAAPARRREDQPGGDLPPSDRQR
jgi:RepB DNA-primase from phage plasmid/CHC2 zinc finger